MALKKSELYSSLWQSCDVLRGGMDASQYKDYVLVMLFLKYISDKYAGQPYAPIQIPKGASFSDLVALKGNTHIGDLINTQIIAPIAAANQQLSASDFPDFNDPNKLGSGKEMVDRLTDLIAVFEKPELDFSGNQAEGDDILGDAYEYLMRHFATESGKSKGQFYTPAEVSIILAHLIGIHQARTTPQTTANDPTCGSGSLLLKVAAAAPTKITLYGQEMDNATAGLARMNMILHDNAEAEIKGGQSTLSNPHFKDKNGQLQTFDYVVANPPFSVKRWSHGFDPVNDPYNRFAPYGIPPEKQGDYAFLLHIVSSMKSTGKAAVILPHGVLFRGNAEAEIRRNLIQRGIIKGIIGLPANLFYGTGIPACIIVLDKEGASERKGIFLIDASKGFLKDGNKNRLREQDIHKITDTFAREQQVEKYSRFVPMEEIEKNDWNLNLPRYIDSTEPEDLQDIEGHLRGGIPERDVEALAEYWKICPELRETLFRTNRPGYLDLAVETTTIRPTITGHPEFTSFLSGMESHFATWRSTAVPTLQSLRRGCRPKEIIATLGESLLTHYLGKPLLDPYDVYQHLRDYWAETMQDDCYLIAAGGWTPEVKRIIEKDKKGKEKDKGWLCDLVPKEILITRYFADQQTAITALESEIESLTAQINELEEEHGGEEGAFGDLEKINKAEVAAKLREIRDDASRREEVLPLKLWLDLSAQEADKKKSLKEAEATLDAACLAKYPTLTETEVKSLVVEEKWMGALSAAIHGEMERISQTLTQRVKELAERYETTLPQAECLVEELEGKVTAHLQKMGFTW